MSHSLSLSLSRTLSAGCLCLSPSALKSISETISVHYPYWSRLQVLGTRTCTHVYMTCESSWSRSPEVFFSVSEGGPLANDEVIRHTANEQQVGKTSPSPPGDMTTGLAYDERMMEHLNLWDRLYICIYIYNMYCTVVKSSFFLNSYSRVFFNEAIRRRFSLLNNQFYS